MNKLEANALRIAELMGWRYNPIFQQNTLDCNTYFADAVKISSNDELIELYSNYQGLMPIVFEIYASPHFTINIYNWVGRCILLAHNSNTTPNWSQEPLDGNYRYDFDIDITENEFIEGLQTVIIKYLELKN